MSVDKPELAITHTTVPRRSRFARTLRALTSPYYRYRLFGALANERL